MEARTRVLDADYRIRDGEPVIRLFCSSGGDNILAEYHGFRPYFYGIPVDDTDDLRQKLEEAEFKEGEEQLPITDTEIVEVEDNRSNFEAVKITTTVPPKVPKLRKKVHELPEVEECREFDIPFYKRFLIDHDITPVQEASIQGEGFEADGFDAGIRVKKIENVEPGERTDFDVFAFDLEVIDNEIVMCAVSAPGYSKLMTTREIDREYVETVESERELVQRFVEIVNQKDVQVLTGYNSDEYDFKKLREAAERHNLELSIGRAGERMKFDRRGRFSSARVKGRMHLDLYPFVEHILSPGLESETLDLDSVAEELLDRNKDDVSFEQMKKWWSSGENLEEFADYALKDAELARDLGIELVPQVFELSRITGLIPFDACRLTYGQLTENFLLREAHERGMLAPNRPFQDEQKKRRREGAYEGGFVYSPEPGLYDDIALLDFASLYPTLMVAHNISPDTLDLEDCSEEYEVDELGYRFCQDEQGFFPELIETLVRERNRVKEEMGCAEPGTREMKALKSRSQARKILANAFYGYLGYAGARWYSREAAEATTHLGRKYIEDAIERAEEMGFEVVYGDTDSVFIRKDNLDEAVEGYLERVNSELPEFMELELEGVFERGFFTSKESGEGAKKKYALLGKDGSMKITGFEFVRRDWSPVAKETQEKVLRLVLEEKPEEAAELVKETVKELQDGEIDPERLKIYTTLTKEPGEYESTAPHVEAAKRAKERGHKVEPGDTVDYVITEGAGNISSRAEMSEYAESYDAEYYIDNQIVPVAYRVLKVFGYTEDQLKGKGRQSGLGRFG